MNRPLDYSGHTPLDSIPADEEHAVSDNLESANDALPYVIKIDNP